jgi:hypothetical protein
MTPSPWNHHTLLSPVVGITDCLLVTNPSEATDIATKCARRDLRVWRDRHGAEFSALACL